MTRPGGNPPTGDTIVVALTRRELRLILGGLNEALEAVDDWEFATRLGAEKLEVEELWSTLKGLMNSDTS